MNNVKTSEQIPRWFYRTFGVLASLNALLIAYTAKLLVTLQISVAVIENTRFTPEKAEPIYQQLAALHKELADLRVQIARLETKQLNERG